MIQFTVPLVPVGKGRPRTAVIRTPQGAQARVFTDARTATAEREFVALAAPHAPQAPLEGALAVELVFVLPIPPSSPAWWREAAAADRIFPRGPKDVDNLAKLALDALTRSGQWWRDDAQIAWLHVRKRYGTVPGTSVCIFDQPEVTRVEWLKLAAKLEFPSFTTPADFERRGGASS